DEVLTHCEEALGDGLVADRVGEHGGDVRGALVHERVGGEEALLLRGDVAAGDALGEHRGPAGQEEDGGDDDDGGSEHRHDLREVGSTEARKPDHRVYSSTPAAMMRMPWPKVSGDSIAMIAPPAMKF